VNITQKKNTVPVLYLGYVFGIVNILNKVSMKQKYIVGDLVKFEDRVCKVLGSRPPIYRGNKNAYTITQKVGWRTDIREGSLEPIPLTTEILEKNRWEKVNLSLNRHVWYKFKTKRSYLYMKKDKHGRDKFLVCIGKDKHNLASISYVHQLQHLLFGLGLNADMEV